MFTDAADACCRLALHNAIANGAVARSDSGVMDGECVVSVDVLRWGEDDTAFVATHGTFHAVIASEVLYIHWVRYCHMYAALCDPRIPPQDDDVAMSAVALSFLTTAAALLWPTTPSSSSLPCEDDSTDGGIILFVYTPRYRGMGPAIRAAAAALSLHMCTLHRSCVVNEEQAATGKFFSLRTVVLSRCASSLRGFVCDLPSGTASDEEDWFNGEEEEDTQPLATIAAGDVFT